MVYSNCKKIGNPSGTFLRTTRVTVKLPEKFPEVSRRDSIQEVKRYYSCRLHPLDAISYFIAP